MPIIAIESALSRFVVPLSMLLDLDKEFFLAREDLSMIRSSLFCSLAENTKLFTTNISVNPLFSSLTF